MNKTRLAYLSCLLIAIVWLAVTVLMVIPRKAGWMDSVMFADPGANLYMGHGFTSSSWHKQTSAEFFAGNAPLHSLLLSCFYGLAGFGQPQTYLFCTILGLTACVLFLWAAVRLGIVTTPVGKLLLFSGLLLGRGTSFAYSDGRYDALALLICSLATLAFSLRDASLRYSSLALIIALFPFAGFHLVPFALAMSLALFLLFKGECRNLLKVCPLSLTAGVGLLSLFYLAGGMLQRFWFLLLTSGYIGTGQVGQLVLGKNRIFLSKFLEYPAEFKDEYSVLLVLIFLGYCCWRLRDRSLLIRTLTFAFAVPGAVLLAGKLPIYYSWMLYVPLLMMAVWCIEHFTAVARPGIAILAVSALAGGLYLPISLSPSNGGVNNKGIEAFVKQVWKDDKVVYADDAAYFACKQNRGKVLTEQYARSVFLPSIPREEADQVSLLIIRPEILEGMEERIGGKWTPVATFNDNFLHLTAYRRM